MCPHCSELGGPERSTSRGCTLRKLGPKPLLLLLTMKAFLPSNMLWQTSHHHHPLPNSFTVWRQGILHSWPTPEISTRP
ncbi:hypothetical protein V6N12_009321 [Hibiscus sabdariffa]|uniref:Uncharacterized protein n=1 Tax=Hibiscus sabdariffa TaxID=183260 RepID=A0ABR2EAM9_9ROSI